MKNLINSLTGKYIVNILMLLVFTGLAITGIFFMEGDGGKGRADEYRQQKSAIGNESFVRSERHGHGSNYSGERFASGRDEGSRSSEGLHQTLGIMWLLLMFLHTWQNWNWYTKLFSLKQIIKDKLLTITTITFSLMILSSLALGIDGFGNLNEIHGFIGQVLTGLMLIHVIQRFKWYLIVTQKLMPGKKVPVSAI